MEFQYNDKTHSSTKDSPFHLTYGAHPWKGELRLEEHNPAAKDFLTQLQKARDEATAALNHASLSMKDQTDKRRNKSRDYQPGDLVWIESANISSDRPSKKLEALRYGPFKVIAKKGTSAYQLDIPKTWRSIHPVFNEYLLTPYQKPRYSGQKKNTRPEAVVVQGREEYEVEEVLNSKKGKGRGTLRYLVKWKGYPITEATWEPPGHLTNAKDAIAAFHRNYPDHPR
jgi:hypothetical protein